MLHFKKLVLAGALISCFQSVQSQDYVGDFSWANTTGSTNSSTVFYTCENGVQVSLSSETAGHQQSVSSAIFPNNTSLLDTMVLITLNFSQPVYNLHLLINDFDEHAPGDTIDGTPSEYGDNFTPGFDAIAPATGNFFTAVGSTGINPNGFQNSMGWVIWNSGGYSSIQFEYHRPDAPFSAGGWGLLLDSMKFDCKPQKPCGCKDDLNYLVNGSSSIPASGTTTADIFLNSGGVALNVLNLSIPNYTLLTNEECRKCNLSNVANFGKILNLPIIAGVTPTFTSPGSGSGFEIVYHFPTPTVVNQNVQLDLQFPPSLDLSCCKNMVDYCLKVSMIDENCQVCESLICLDGGSSTGGSTGSSTKSSAAHLGPINVLHDGKTTPEPLKVYPNPVQNVLNIELPNDMKKGSIEILDVNGKTWMRKTVNANHFTLDISSLNPGNYIITHKSNDSVQSTSFVKN